MLIVNLQVGHGHLEIGHKFSVYCVAGERTVFMWHSEHNVVLDK